MSNKTVWRAAITGSLAALGACQSSHDDPSTPVASGGNEATPGAGPGSPVTLALDHAGRFAYVGTSTDDGKRWLYAFKVSSNGALNSAGDALELGAVPSYVGVEPSGHFAYLTETDGIHGYAVNPATGVLTELEHSPFGVGSVFGGAIAFDPNARFLYTSGAGLNGFAIAADGTLTRIAGSPFALDVSSDPTATNIAIEPQGKFLYATQFSGGRSSTFQSLPRRGNSSPYRCRQSPSP